MNKTDLVKQLSRRVALPRMECLRFINELQDIMMDELRRNDSVMLQGFGVFKVWDQTERLGRNPRTGTPCMIAPRRSVKFKPGKELLYVLNNRSDEQE